jgi:YVTN family beta-propeller protein
MAVVVLTGAAGLVADLLAQMPASATPSKPLTALARIGVVSPIVGSLSEIGAAPAGAHLQFEVILKPRDLGALTNFATAVSTPGNPLYRHFLPKGRLAQAFGPTPAAIASVKSALAAAGFTPGRVSADGLSIHVSTTVGRAEAGLHTTIASYRLASGRVATANTSAPSLPVSIAADVQAVIGLNTTTRVQPEAAPGKPSAPRPSASRIVASASPGAAASPCNEAQYVASSTGSYTADELAQAYGFDGLYRAGDLGAGATVALYELEPYDPTDIATYQSCYGTGTAVTNISVDDGAGTGSGSGEAALDIEDVIGLAPEANIEVYEAPNTAEGAIDNFRRIATDDTAQVVSTSWGGCEALDGNSTSAESTVLAEMVAQGQTVFASTGDSGSEDCLPRTGEITARTGKGPDALAADPGTGTVYVADKKSAKVTVESESDLGPVATVSVGHDPEGVAVDPGTGNVYVADATAPGSVSVINASTCDAVDHSDCKISTIAGLGDNPDGIAVDPTDGTVYVANRGSGNVSVISEASGAIVGTVTLGNKTEPFGIAIDSTTHQVYVTDSKSDTVSVIAGANCSASTQTGCASVPPTIAVGTGPEGVAVDSATDIAYVANNGDGTVSVINGATNVVSATIGIDSATDLEGVALAPDGNEIMVTSGITDFPNSSAAVVVISTTTNDVLRLLPADLGNEAITVDPTTGYIFTADMTGGGNRSEKSGPGDLGVLPLYLDVDDPADQPNVTAVGGTDLTAVAGPTETAWNYPRTITYDPPYGSGGGGISSLFPMPSYQTSVTGPDSSGAPCGNSDGDCREIPDVSASADPQNGYVICYKGQWILYGGTSAATPLWAALIALVVVDNETQTAERLGNINPDLYLFSSEGHPDFNDVTTGNNDYTLTNGGTYEAGPGYDMVTGLGSPKGSALAADLDASFTDPVVTTEPVNQTGKAGKDVTFTAAASGLPVPTVQWLVSTDGGGTFSSIPGATSDSYTFKVKASADGNEYEAVFTNSVGSVTSDPATLTNSRHHAIGF